MRITLNFPCGRGIRCLASLKAHRYGSVTLSLTFRPDKYIRPNIIGLTKATGEDFQSKVQKGNGGGGDNERTHPANGH